MTASWRRPNGLSVKKVRIPLGVVLMVYEARPNVTVDAAALCVKSGNAAILRPGSDALRSSLALARGVRGGARARRACRAASAQVVPTPDREATFELLQLDDLIDLAIPRGGPSLIRAVAERSRVPVVKHYQGVCHLFLDETRAARPGGGARAERQGAAPRRLQRPRVPARPPRRGAEAPARRSGARSPTRAWSSAAARRRSPILAPRRRPRGRRRSRTTSASEFLDKILAVRVVHDLDGALDHIARYGSLHTEAIVTRDLANARRFEREVTASAVMVNASTRFNDGGELGLGAEIGISTTKLHAFGPMGLAELTTQKYVVEGDGHVRS